MAGISMCPTVHGDHERCLIEATVTDVKIERCWARVNLGYGYFAVRAVHSIICDSTQL